MKWLASAGAASTGGLRSDRGKGFVLFDAPPSDEMRQTTRSIPASTTSVTAPNAR
jgi:hypothetical protein